MKTLLILLMTRADFLEFQNTCAPWGNYFFVVVLTLFIAGLILNRKDISIFYSYLSVISVLILLMGIFLHSWIVGISAFLFFFAILEARKALEKRKSTPTE